MDDRERGAGSRVGDDERGAGIEVDRVAVRRAVEQVHADERGDVARAWAGRDVREGAALDDGAVFQDDEAIGERGRVERIVGDEQAHAAERGQVSPQLSSHRAPCALVEGGERFVEEQQPRFGGQRARERDPLGLPARECPRLLARERGQVDAIERGAARRRAPGPDRYHGCGGRRRRSRAP